MEDTIEKTLKIIDSQPEGILQCQLWKILQIDSRKCSRIIDYLLKNDQIIRKEYRKEGIKTFLIKTKKTNKQIFETIKRDYCSNHNCSVEQLIKECRIIANGKILKSPDQYIIQSYYILDKPLNELIINDLMANYCPIPKLAKKYGIVGPGIFSEISRLMDSTTLFDQGFLLKHNSELSFKIVPIPVEAKIFDPFFGFSLLNWKELLVEFYDEIEILPKNENLIEYSQLISHLWGLPTYECYLYLSTKQLFFINSTFGPIPILFSKSIYNQISESLLESDNVGKRILSPKNIDKTLKKIDKQIKIGVNSVLEVENCIINLASLIKRCMNIQDPIVLEKVHFINERFFKELFSVYYQNIHLKGNVEGEKNSYNDERIDDEGPLYQEEYVPLKIGKNILKKSF